jgi:outer membrane receptor protein involved in Fe transport
MKITNRVPRHFLNIGWLLVMAPGVYAQNNDFSGVQVQKPQLQVQTIEEIVVTAQRRAGLLDELDREYTSVDGKRIFEGPHGEM